MKKFQLTVTKEVEAKDLHEAVEKVCDNPMEYMLFEMLPNDDLTHDDECNHG